MNRGRIQMTTQLEASRHIIEYWQAKTVHYKAALDAIEQLLEGTQPIDIPGALMIIRTVFRDNVRSTL